MQYMEGDISGIGIFGPDGSPKAPPVCSPGSYPMLPYACIAGLLLFAVVSNDKKITVDFLNCNIYNYS